ncbi:hypothetical protein [Paenibacillus lautus]|uniref:hypothetical protein n=1 Tax=Paenibacillus lautus TaxID=1401 RepID=UPI003D264D86
MNEIQEEVLNPKADKAPRKKKENPESDKSPNAWEYETAVIYVGPTIPKLARYTTFRAGFPRPIQKLMERIPELKGLFVPVPEFPKVRLQTETVGTPLHAAHQAVLSAQQQKGSV